MGREIAILGLNGSFPRAANNWKIEVSLPQEKAWAWIQEINEHLKNGIINAVPLENLIGKHGFSQTNLFGKFARTKLRPLYKKLHATKFSPKIASFEGQVLRWCAKILLSLNPRAPRGVCRQPDFVVYTDAATLSNKMAATALQKREWALSALNLLTPNVPRFWENHFRRENIILGSEMRTFVAFLNSEQKLSHHKRINIYMDNDPAANALIRGDCSNPFLTSMVCIFRKLVGDLSLDVWIGRVGSQVNPADLPTRGAKIPFDAPLTAQFKNLYKLLNGALISQRG